MPRVSFATMNFAGTTLDLFEYASQKSEDGGEGDGGDSAGRGNDDDGARKPRQPLIPYALRNGQLVHVSNVERGKHSDCRCVACGEELVARKGEQVAHHFAHSATSNCQSETVLHRAAKFIAAEKLEQCMQKRRPMWIKWKCETCSDFHKGNLVKIVTGLEIEKSLGEVRPDILLSDREGKPRVAIEIIVTHPPEQRTIEFYRTNKITMVTLDVKNLEDLQTLHRLEDLPVSRVDACARQKCQKCKKILWRRNLCLRRNNCRKCRHYMTIATVEIEQRYGSRDYDDWGGIGGIRAFDQKILEVTGVRLCHGRDGLLNSCPSCRHPVYPETFLRHHKWRLVQRTIPSGLYCESCDNVFSNTDKKSQCHLGRRLP